jgi:hypothetical protein
VGAPTFGTGSVTVAVRGSEKYNVRVDWTKVERGNELLIDCSCPHFARGSFCKHSWAVVLFLDDEGISAEIPGKNRLKLAHARAHQPRQGKAGRERGRRGRGRNGNERDPEEPGPRHHLPAPESAPALPRTAFFLLDLERSRLQGEAVISFFHQNSYPDGRTGPVQPGSVSRGELALYTSPQDRDVLGMLLAGTGMMSTFAQANLAHSSAVVPTAVAAVVLQRMAQTGRF